MDNNRLIKVVAIQVSKGAAGSKRFLDIFGLLFKNVVRWRKPPFEGAVLKCDTRFLLISC